MVTGSAVTVLLIVWPEMKPWPIHPGAYGLAVNLLVLSIRTLTSPADATPEANRFIEIAASSPSSSSAPAGPS